MPAKKKYLTEDDRREAEREYQRRWRAEHPERSRAIKQKWAESNKGKIREKNIHWATNNRERKLATDLKWRTANRKKVNARAREQQRKWRKENPEKAREKDKRRYLKSRKNNKEWQERMKDNQRKRLGRVDSGRRKGVVMPPEIRYARSRKIIRHDYLKKKYGISLEEFNQMVEKQNGCCAICGKHHSENFMQSLCVDHDHKTGRVRGLLCRRCNAGIGNLNDSIQLLQNAVAYLIS